MPEGAGGFTPPDASPEGQKVQPVAAPRDSAAGTERGDGLLIAGLLVGLLVGGALGYFLALGVAGLFISVLSTVGGAMVGGAFGGFAAGRLKGRSAKVDARSAEED
jgi:hypothetical protein